MDEKSKFVEPYKPSLIHAVYRWIDRLPGPYWLFSIVFLVMTGLLNLIVAWKENVIAFGEINWSYAFTGFFFAYYFFANDFLYRVANNSVLEFLTILDTPENRRRQILFEFTHIPARASTIFFILGAIIGLILGIYLLPTASELNYAFPELEIPMYSLSMGMVFITLYGVIRALGLINQLFDEKIKIDIFDQTSIYAISRYSAWLIIVVAISSSLQFVLIPSFTEITATVLLITIIPWILALLIFWLPLRGVNLKLVSEKRRLLRDVNLRVKTNFDLLHSKMDNHEYQNIADVREMIAGLQVEREYIKSISTWPWQTSTFTGLLTAVVLPVLVSFLIDVIGKFIN
jgi:hypothetical protein